MTTNRDFESELVPLVRQMQIIIGALILGTLTFLAIALVVQATDDAQAPNDGMPLLTLIAFFMAAVAVAMQFVMPNFLATNALRQSEQAAAQSGSDRRSRSDGGIDIRRFGQAYMAQTMVAGALLEGAAFMALVAYLIEGNLLCVLLAVLLVMGIAARFPTTSKVAAWIEAKHKQLEEERHLAN